MNSELSLEREQGKAIDLVPYIEPSILADDTVAKQCISGRANNITQIKSAKTRCEQIFQQVNLFSLRDLIKKMIPGEVVYQGPGLDRLRPFCRSTNDSDVMLMLVERLEIFKQSVTYLQDTSRVIQTPSL